MYKVTLFATTSPVMRVRHWTSQFSRTSWKLGKFCHTGSKVILNREIAKCYKINYARLVADELIRVPPRRMLGANNDIIYVIVP